MTTYRTMTPYDYVRAFLRTKSSLNNIATLYSASPGTRYAAGTRFPVSREFSLTSFHIRGVYQAVYESLVRVYMAANRLSSTLSILTRSYDRVEPERIVEVSGQCLLGLLVGSPGRALLTPRPRDCSYSSCPRPYRCPRFNISWRVCCEAVSIASVTCK